MKAPRIVSIALDGSIPYVALDPTPGGSNFGRAVFQFCPIWKRGRMAELLIFRRQQRSLPAAYRLALPAKAAGRVTTFSFHVWADVDQPRCWRMGWCEEHATVTYEVYVPNNTDALTFHPHFGNSIDIHFGKASENAADAEEEAQARTR
jgi:hypothetical protein